LPNFTAAKLKGFTVN